MLRLELEKMNWKEYWQEKHEKIRTELVKKWERKDTQLLRSRMRKGWKVKDFQKRTIVLPHIGAITYLRRRYEKSGVFRYFLDEKLGFIKWVKVHQEVKIVTAEMLKEKISGTKVQRLLQKQGVRISLQTIYNCHKVAELWGQKREEKLGAEKKLYLNVDDGFVTTTAGSVRVRLASSYTDRKWCFQKDRWRLVGKKYSAQLYKEGEKLLGQRYGERLQMWISQHYNTTSQTEHLGATDGDRGLKRIVRSLPNAVPIHSKYHYKRNKKYLAEEKWKVYVKNNKEGVENWKRKDCFGYSAESDIWHKLKSVTTGKVLSERALVNFLESSGVEVFR